MKILVILFLICIFFLLTRLIYLSQIPASLYWDEASIGYNAYSLTLDFKDEWGEALPIHFRSFGEFKLPVYIYSVAILVKLFGLNEWAVRIPAVLYSLTTILVVFLISKKLFTKNGEQIGLVSAFVLSTLPWFFLFSRTGFEATAGVAFFCLGFYLFLVSKQSLLIKVLSAVAFILSIYSYNSFRIITPIFLIPIFAVWFKRVDRKNLLPVLFLLILSITALYPVAKLNLTEQSSRFKNISIFNEEKNLLNLTYIFVNNYFSHLNPEFLFIKGDNNLRSHSGFGGMLYPVDVIFFVISIWGAVVYKEKKLIPVFFILFLSFIPAAIGKEIPHSLRSILFPPFVAIVIAYGIVFSKNCLKFKHFLPIVIFLYLIFFFFYFADFLKNYNLRSSINWQYPYRVVFSGNANKFKKYDKVFISDDLGQPYIFALYFQKYSPTDFRRTVKYNSPDKWGYSLVKSFNNYIFDLDEISESKEKILIIAKPGEYKGKKEKVSEIKDLSGRVVFSLYE